MNHLLAFHYPSPSDSTTEYRLEKEVRLHDADLAMDYFHSRKGKKSKKSKSNIATVNLTSVRTPSVTSIPLERINRSNKRADRRIYPKVNEIDVTGTTAKIAKVRQTPGQLRILDQAIHRERRSKQDTSYLVDEGTFFREEEEFPPPYTEDDYEDNYDDDRSYEYIVWDRWDYGGYGW